MPPTLDELREQRNEAATQADQIVTRDDATLEELEQADTLLGSVEDLDKRIKVLERNDKVKDRLAEPRPDPVLPTGTAEEARSEKAYGKAFGTWLRGGRDALDGNQIRTLSSGYLDLSGETRALGTGGTAGGYTIPAGFLRKITETMKEFGGMRQVANVISTDNGAALPWPSNNDTANLGAILDENTAMSELDVAFTTKTLGAWMYVSGLTRVSYQLLQDTAFDLEAFLGRKLGERIGRIQNRHFTVGAGTTLPLGLVTGGTVAVTAASATAVTLPELMQLKHSIDPAYRNSGRAKWMMSDTSIALVEGLLDGDNRPMWQPDLTGSGPDRLMGYPVVVNQDMAAPTAALKPIAFGDFTSGYIIRDVKGIQLTRLDERYAEYLQVGFFAYARADGTPDDTAAYRILQMHA